MKLTKTSNYSNFNRTKQEDYIQNVDTDLSNIFTAFKGRVRFGSGVDDARGENLEGEFQVFTTAATGGTVVNHTLSATPIGYIIIKQNANGVLWLASATTASITFASNTTATSFTVFLLK